ncbi:hypothetical protein [Brevibacterium otitidis]|uniref:Uncharacterized protein n=1 Tax=Brevibacterium otitidis TaxID=53364 RepID=A0ABV5WZ01_9MICO|nr:hypothetical protein GCM10023233_19050 [Brevibacterium otitidis]
MNSGSTPPPMPPQPPHGPGGSNGGPAYGSGPSYGSAGAPSYGSGPSSGADSGYGSGPTYSASPPGPDPAESAGTSGPGTPTGSVPQPAPAPGYAAAPGGPGAQSPAGDQQKQKKPKLPLILSLGAVALVLVLVLVGFFVVRSVNHNKYGPDRVAEEYLSALESGNIDEANKITKATTPDGASEKLLLQQIVDGSEQKITDAQVVETTREGKSAKVHTKYTIDGQPYDLILNATKEGRQNLFFDKWTLEPPVLPTVTMEVPPIAGATINGTEFSPESGRVEYAVWPGRYDVSIPESKYVSGAEGNATVGFADADNPQNASISMSVEATDDFEKDVKKLVEDKIKECAEVKKAEVDDCPMVNFPWADTKGKVINDKVDEKTIKREIKEMPKINVVLSPDGSRGSFYTDYKKPGKISISAESKDRKLYWPEDTRDLEANGTVDIDGDELKVSFF